MKIKQSSIIIFILTTAIMFLYWASISFSQAQLSTSVHDVTSLIKAVNHGNNGDMIVVKAGVYELPTPLIPKSGMSIVGTGDRQTIITAASSWQPSIESLPAKENPAAYLFNLSKVSDISISNLKLTAGNLHGAIYAKNTAGIELKNLLIQDFLWSSIRTFRMDNFRVHDNVFIDAGGKQRWVGGALNMDWTKNSEFWNNKIFSSKTNQRKFYGFKGRGATNLHFHHNDVQVNFSLEFPFENDRAIEIDHNNFVGVISIPKYAGGLVLEKELAYHIHHNWLKRSYALEWARNAVEIDHNLFDFNVVDGGGNLISNHGDKAAPGFTLFHDNLIKNPGLGIFWTKGIYNQFRFYNNHVKANNLSMNQGLFEFHPQTNFPTIEIRDNIIENTANNPRPLMRNQESYAAIIENNRLKNISDTSAYDNLQKQGVQGLLEPLYFQVGVDGEYTVNNWNVTKSVALQ